MILVNDVTLNMYFRNDFEMHAHKKSRFNRKFFSPKRLFYFLLID